MTDKKILLVDFDEESLASLSNLVYEEGFQAETATDGLAGYEKFKAENFDLVILEPMLPKLHGFELCKKISQDPIKKVPIIIVTGIYREPSCKMEALQVYGASAFFTKPWNRDDLRAKILQLLVRSQEAPVRRAEQPAAPAASAGPQAKEIPAAKSPSREPRMNKDMDEIERELRQVVSGLAGKPIKKEVKEVVREKTGPKETLDSEIDAMLKGAIGGLGLEAKKKKPEASARELIDLIPGLRMHKVEPAAQPAPAVKPTVAVKPAPTARPALPVIPNLWPKAEAKIPFAKEIKAKVPAPEKPVNNIPPAASRAHLGAGRKPFGIDQTLIEIDKIAYDLPKVPAEPEKAPEKDKKVYFDEYAEPQKKKASFAVIGGLVAVIVIATSVTFFVLKSKKPSEPPRNMVSSLQPTLPAEFTSRQEELKTPPVSAQPESRPTVKKPAVQTEDQPPAEFIAPVQAPLTSPSEAGTLGQEEQATGKTENPPPNNEPSASIPTETITPPLSSQPQTEQPATSPPAVQPGALVPLDQVEIQPALVKRIEPKYPPLALNMGLSGTVTVNSLISETGDVVRTEILKGIKGGHGFERAAEVAIKQWKFRPARKDGVNVKVWKPRDINFKLSELSTKE